MRLFPAGGEHRVNDRAPLDYLKRETLVQAAMHALTLTNTVGKYTVIARVHGGGLTGQSGALRMAIARALVREDESLRGLLGREGLLTRDARMKERKKYGQPGGAQALPVQQALALPRHHHAPNRSARVPAGTHA